MSSHSLPSRVAPTHRTRLIGDHDGETPPLRSLPSSPRMTRPTPKTRAQTSRRPQDRASTRTNSFSTASSSTSGSSFLDRMKVASSRTSLAESQEELPARKGGSAPVRGKAAVDEEDEEHDEEDSNQGTLGYGYALWGRVTAVASNLTVNVSQAWQKSVNLVDGEETPPGQESRLTKAMKAYHLDRAKSPADLPSWLFDERERGVASRSWNLTKSEDYEDRFLPERDPQSRSRGGLREVYDRAAAAQATGDAQRKLPEGGNSGSRATDRLKALRDAKRSAFETGDGQGSIIQDAARRPTGAGRVGLAGRRQYS